MFVQVLYKIFQVYLGDALKVEIQRQFTMITII